LYNLTRFIHSGVRVLMTQQDQRICHCDKPGWCERHRCLKPDILFRLCRTDERYFHLWEVGQGPGQQSRAVPVASRPCAHRGEVVREEDCDSCHGRVRLKVFECSMHGACSLARPIESVACCEGCPDYKPLPLDDIRDHPEN
jgi:hypothetical protein